MQDQLWVEPVGNLIIARVRGVPTEAILQECQERVLLLVQDTGQGRVLYDALEMESPSVDVTLSQRRLDEALGPVCSCGAPLWCQTPVSPIWPASLSAKEIIGFFTMTLRQLSCGWNNPRRVERRSAFPPAWTAGTNFRTEWYNVFTLPD